jgi:hypothetical protein
MAHRARMIPRYGFARDGRLDTKQLFNSIIFVN